jgi:hypothetical protein
MSEDDKLIGLKWWRPLSKMHKTPDQRRKLDDKKHRERRASQGFRGFGKSLIYKAQRPQGGVLSQKRHA